MRMSIFFKASQILGGTKNEPPPFTQNQFGASAGGRLIKDKTFWFFSWESFRLRQGQVFTTNVPTAAERNGDFTGLTDQAGNPITIYDPATTDPNTGVRQEFPDPQRYSAQRARPDGSSAAEPLSPAHRPWYLQQLHCCHQCGRKSQPGCFPHRPECYPERSACFSALAIGTCSILPVDPLGTGLCVGELQRNNPHQGGCFRLQREL